MGKTHRCRRGAVAGLWMATAMVLGMSAGCSQDPADGPARLDLQIVRSSRRPATADPGGAIVSDPSTGMLPGATAPKRQTDRVIAAVLDASDQTLAGIPVSAAYEDLAADYAGQRLALTTWPQWRDLLARHYTIVDEQQLVIEGSTATGTLRAVFGWNLVAVAFLDTTTVTWIGIGPGRATPGGTGVAVVRVEPPVGYQLPGTGPLDVILTAPGDDEILTTPVANVTGFLNDPFLEAGTLQLDNETPRPLPLLTGFFAAPVPIAVGPHQVTVEVERTRTEELAIAAVPFERRDPLAVWFDDPPGDVVTSVAELYVQGQINDSGLDSIVVSVDGVRFMTGYWEVTDWAIDLPVPLNRGPNVVRVDAYRGAESAADQVTITRREPLYVRLLELGGRNGFFVDGNLGSFDTNLDAPSPTFTIEGSLPANSRLRFRWRNLTTTASASLGVTDPASGGLIETPVRPAGAWYQDELALRALPDGRHTFYYVYHLSTQGFGAAEIDQMTLLVGNAADGELFTLGAVDDSGADLNWGALGEMAGAPPAPPTQTMTFRGEVNPYRQGIAIRFSPGTSGPAAGEGVVLRLDDVYESPPTGPLIPGGNATYVEQSFGYPRIYYGQHTAQISVWPPLDATAGVLIDVVVFEFDGAAVGTGFAREPLPGGALDRTGRAREPRPNPRRGARVVPRAGR